MMSALETFNNLETRITGIEYVLDNFSVPAAIDLYAEFESYLTPQNLKVLLRNEDGIGDRLIELIDKLFA